MRCPDHQLLSYAPEPGVGLLFPCIISDSKYPSEHSHYVSVQNRLGLIESDTTDCACRVRADPWQFQYPFEFLRESAAIAFDYELSRFLHITHPGVVAQPFPEFMDCLWCGVGEGLNVWQCLHPTLPIGQHRFDLGLLEHDLGNPNGIGV